MASAFAQVPSSCPWDLEWQSTGEGPHTSHTGGGNSAPQAAGRGPGVCTGHTRGHVGTCYADDGDGHGRAAWDLGRGGSGLCVGGGWGCWWAGDPKCDLLAMGDWGLGHMVPWVGGDRAGVAASQEGGSG